MDVMCSLHMYREGNIGKGCLFPCLGCCSLGRVGIFERSRLVAPRKGKWSAGYSSQTAVDQAEGARCRSLLCPGEREGCSREVQGAGTQTSFSSRGKNVFLRGQKRLRKVFGKSVRFGLGSKVGGKFSHPERGWLAQGIFCFSPFFEVCFFLADLGFLQPKNSEFVF